MNTHSMRSLIVLTTAALTACTVFDEKIVVRECEVNSDCRTRFSDDGSVPGVCVHTETPYCAQVPSDTCPRIFGNPSDDGTILIASMFNATSSIQDSVIMAIDEINTAGGIPAQDGAKRQLALVMCDAMADKARSIDHLVNELHVPALIGPTSSSDVFALTATTGANHTMMLTPTAIASAIVELGTPNALTRLMVPTDKQRSKMLQDQIAEIEAQLKVTRPGRPLKLAIYYRDDLTGQGTRDGLANLMFNGASLIDNINSGTASSIGYDPVAASMANWRDTNTVELYISGKPPAPAFRPDIIVMVGGQESINGFFTPLEDAWQAMIPGVAKPYWVVGDAGKQPAILAKVGGGASVNDALRLRIRGTGLTTTDVTAAQAYSAYQQHFNEYWTKHTTSSGMPYPSTTPSTTGMGPAYDAVYTIAFALAAAREVGAATRFVAHPTGDDIARGIEKLTDANATTKVSLADTAGTVAAFRELAANRTIFVTGTFGPLRWDAKGAKAAGQVNMWCISAPPTATASSFKDSNVVFDIGSNAYMAPNVTGQYYTTIPPSDRGPPTACAPVNTLPD